MEDVQHKAALLTFIQTEHIRLETCLKTLTEKQMLRPGVTGDWSVKDILAHLTWWEQDLIWKITSGWEIDPDPKQDLWATDHANALIVEARRETPLAVVLADFQRSYQRILQMVEGFTEKDLANTNLYNALVINTASHYAEHCEWIETVFSQPKGPGAF